jgi:hypothetical protein
VKASDRHWLAGLLEGEGYFTASWQNSRVSNRRWLLVRVGIESTDEDVVQRAHTLLGGYHAGPHKRSASALGTKDRYVAHVQRRADVKKVCRSLRPLMSFRRRAQIDNVLRAIELYEHQLK